MNHWVVAPVLWPLLAGALLVLLERSRPSWARPASLAAALILLAIAVKLLLTSMAGEVGVYLLGNWRAPFGIALLADRLAALMLVLTAVVALASLAAAVRGEDRQGPHFHALFHFQLMGLNGAFLTADLFNLFVFFELLLIGSYGLLLHGARRMRLQMGLATVVINLLGSALFLIAASLLYSATGTLNLADMAQKLGALPAADASLARAGAWLLLLVFGLKAAILPLNFWLPASYGAASAPVAALFAILTKVGIYAILRVTTLLLGEQGGALANLAQPVLLPLALATLAIGAVGVLAARDLSQLVGHLVIVSAGTLLAAIGIAGGAGIAGALVYLIHSTLVAATLFLLAGVVRAGRGEQADRLEPGPSLARPGATGVAFFVAAATVAGLPPFSGFVAKLLILDGALAVGQGAPLLAVVLGSGLLVVLALSRAGSTLFWNTRGAAGASGEPDAEGMVPALCLLAAGIAVVVLAGPIHAFAEDAARQLLDPAASIARVLGEAPR